MWGFAPVLTRLGRDMGFVPFVLTSCAVLFVAALLIRPAPPSGGILNIFAPSLEGNFIFGMSGRDPVFAFGRWWTVLTATWLHGNLLHIIMNMMAVRSLAPIVAELFGASRMIIIYVLSGVVGFTASTLAGLILGPIQFIGGGIWTVGASASIAGLIGAVYLYGHRTGSSGASEQARSWIMMLVIMGFMPLRIDNWAHLGGVVGGYFCAKLLDPLHSERLDHFLIALGLLLLTAAAIAVSVVTGLRVLSA
jgi:rhomboid protease GluP